MKPWMAWGLGLLVLAGLAAPARSQPGYPFSYPVSYCPARAGAPASSYYSYPSMPGMRAQVPYYYYVVPQPSAPSGYGWPTSGPGMPAMTNGVGPAGFAPPMPPAWPVAAQPVGVYSFARTVSAHQSEIVPQQSDVASPPTVSMPSATHTGSASPTCCDSVSRVPNFLGDFVARPSVGLVNQPVTSTVATTTLTFVGNSIDVDGGTGPNTFYAPVVFTGPGGPYLILTDVLGFGVRIPPLVSILRENAQLTAAIQANFPGATFAGGIGPLFVSTNVFFDYLLTTGQTVPGLVAVFSLPNPSGGGLVGRNKYFDDGSPLPRDRVFVDYSHVGDFQGLGTSFDVNRYVFGAERTFLDGSGSVEVRVPFAGTVDSDQIGGQALDVNDAEFGNVGLLFKGSLFRNANWIVTAGLGLSMPTADDSRLLFEGRTILEIRNQAWLIQPILVAAWAPNDRFYAQAGLQFDFAANGNPVNVRSPGGEFAQRGVLTDQTYLYTSAAVGYWLYQSDTNYLSGVSLQGELHYNRTLGNRDFVLTGSALVTDLNDNLDVLNGTTGVNFVLNDRAVLALGVSFPLDDEWLYDWSLLARLNVRFGTAAP
jgi:hypothetical protein